MNNNNNNNNNESENQDQNIRKYRKKVNRSGWMFRLYKYTWGVEPRFIGYCAFFWATWICVGLFPFIIAGNIATFLIKLVGSFFTNTSFSSKNTIQEQKSIKYEKPSDRAIVDFYLWVVRNEKNEDFNLFNFHHSNYSYSEESSIVSWAEQNSNWKDYYPIALENVKIAKEQAKINAERLAARQKFFNEKKELIIKYLSPLVKPTLFLSSLYVIFWVYKLTFYVVSNTDWGYVGFMALKVVIFWVFALAVTLLIAAFAKTISIFFNKFKNISYLAENSIENSVKENDQKESKVYFFNRILGGICEGTEFLIDTVKMLYKKECPLIVYTENESGKIEKITKSE